MTERKVCVRCGREGHRSSSCPRYPGDALALLAAVRAATPAAAPGGLPGGPDSVLPAGVDCDEAGQLFARCCVCGAWGDLDADLADLPDDYRHHCGGSSRCCP